MMNHRRWRGVLLVGLVVLTTGSAPSGMPAGDMTHQMMVLVIQLGVILLAARAGNLLFERMKMPGVVGELMAGVVIGPCVLGSLPLPTFPHGLFPQVMVEGGFPVTAELYGICTVASVVLLFLVGLETDVKLFVRYSLAGSLVGIGGVLFSFLFGAGTGVLFSEWLLGQPYGFLDAPCLFLGIVCTATSVGIPARILSEKGRLDSPEGVTILAGAVIDDVLGIILLAVGIGIISASGEGGHIDWAQIGGIALGAITIWLTATIIGLLAAHRISRALKLVKDPSLIAIMALALALILAGLFEQTGLAMIIGAYVMGLSLSRTDLSHLIRERLQPTYLFLVPVFFTVMGMLVDLRMLASPRVIGFGLVYSAVAVATKMLGCGIPALFANFNLRGALRIGAGMLPRGEVALIIAGAGLASGMLSPEVFGVVILMTLTTTLLAPPLLLALFRDPRSGLRHPTDEAESAPVTFSFPSVQAAELLVSKLLTSFENEGFFVHTLSHDDRLYQLRQNAVVIGFRQRGTDIVFECGPGDVPFVNAAMIDVVADLEQTVRELRKPLDMKEIGRRLQESEAKPPSTSSIKDFIRPALLQPVLRSATKEAIIDELLGLLDKTGRIQDLELARREVLEREQSMSTGMQYGVAIPHARTDAVSQLECVIGLQKEGIDFDAMDEEPSRIFVMVLSPRHAAAPHVQFMSTVSQVLDESGRAALLACTTPSEMYHALTRSRGRS